MLLFPLAALIAALALWWAVRAYVRAGTERPKAARVLGAAGLAGLAALGVYLALGRPATPDEPFAERLAQIRARDPEAMSGAEMLAVLSAQARKEPADPRPHIFIGQLLAEEGRDAEAGRAFEAALRRDPTSAAAMIGLGRALFRLQEGAVTPEARALFEAAAALTPDDPIPWFYQALAASQESRAEDAARLWPEVLKRLPADDPRRAMAAAMAVEAKAKVTQGAQR